jgi:hypothetical protein
MTNWGNNLVILSNLMWYYLGKKEGQTPMALNELKGLRFAAVLTQEASLIMQIIITAVFWPFLYPDVKIKLD